MRKEFYFEQLKKIMNAINKMVEEERDELTIKDTIDMLRLQFDVLREIYNQDKDGDTNDNQRM